jgi:hypothetical protein
MRDLRGDEAPVDRHRDRAAAKARPFQLIETGGVGRLDAEAPALGETQPRENPCRDGDPFAILSPGQVAAVPAINDGRPLPVMADRTIENFRKSENAAVLRPAIPGRSFRPAPILAG